MGNLTREDTVLTVQGTEIPRLGLGTWQLTGRAAAEGVQDALEIGYRHVTELVKGTCETLSERSNGATRSDLAVSPPRAISATRSRPNTTRRCTSSCTPTSASLVRVSRCGSMRHAGFGKPWNATCKVSPDCANTSHTHGVTSSVGYVTSGRSALAVVL